MTATTITKRNCVNKKDLTNKVFLANKKGLLPYKQDLLTYIKKDFLTYTKTHGKWPRQIRGRFSWQIPTANSHGK